MSYTKRYLEQLMEKKEYKYPPPLCIKLEKDTPNSADCPCCGVRFEQKMEIPNGEYCPKCYFENNN